MFSTQTKTNTKNILGTAGTREVLRAIEGYPTVGTVAIGGINASNVQRILYQSAYPSKKLDGVAIVSAIIAASDPEEASKHLRQLVDSPPVFLAESLRHPDKVQEVGELVGAVPTIIKRVAEVGPLCHNMTNLVVQNFAANVALCIGASPIMANYGEEARDLAQLGGGLVINMGTVTPEGLDNYLKALKAYNVIGGPVVYDPVGAGATAVRRAAVKNLMAGGYFDLIKGNEAEIKTVWGQAGQGKGVDSGVSTLDSHGKAKLVYELARREGNVVLMTGTTDYISDGQRVFAIDNGHEYLGAITGSGCVLGTTMAAMLAVHREDKLLAAVAGILHYEIAAEIAAAREDVKGPGTFVPAFLDELYQIKKDSSEGKLEWLKRAKVHAVTI
jgi:thiamine-phosphate diphosphorylase/hydroxyethylthiazole kinase